MRVVIAIACVVLAAVVAAMLARMGGDLSGKKADVVAKGRDLSDYASGPPTAPIDIVFLHHSVGQQLLAAHGSAPAVQDGILAVHPNGGGLAGRLAASNYRLHDATYGSAIAEHTDLFDWLPKFRDQMDVILSIRHQDQRLPSGEQNRVVMFKSCFPNSGFAARDAEASSIPGLTQASARATMTAVRAELEKQPGVLFVYLTAPPLAPRTWSEPAWKWLVKKAIGRPTHDEDVLASGAAARAFNNWMVDPDGWLKGYPHRNIVVFDLFDVLTDHGASNFSRYATGDGGDSHPSAEGNAKVAPDLVLFLNRAVRYAGIVRTW